MAGPPSPIFVAPATVVMTPEGSTLPTRWFPSEKNRFPMWSTATPKGESNRASMAGPPSPLKPRSPVPATVLMTPEVSTLRMRWVP